MAPVMAVGALSTSPSRLRNTITSTRGRPIPALARFAPYPTYREDAVVAPANYGYGYGYRARHRGSPPPGAYPYRRPYYRPYRYGYGPRYGYLPRTHYGYGPRYGYAHRAAPYYGRPPRAAPLLLIV